MGFCLGRLLGPQAWMKMNEDGKRRKKWRDCKSLQSQALKSDSHMQVAKSTVELIFSSSDFDPLFFHSIKQGRSFTPSASIGRSSVGFWADPLLFKLVGQSFKRLSAGQELLLCCGYPIWSLPLSFFSSWPCFVGTIPSSEGLTFVGSWMLRPKDYVSKHHEAFWSFSSFESEAMQLVARSAAIPAVGIVAAALLSVGNLKL